MRRLMCVALLLAACHGNEKKQSAVNGGDAEKGKEAVVRYGCTSCHNIPGVEGPRGMVGPTLDRMGSRPMIAGKFQNTAANMEQWIQSPQALDPNSAMPSVGVTPQDAKDMTAYLFTLK